MKEKRDIDELFRTGLSEHTESAPNFAWDNISDELNRKKKIVYMRYVRYAAASVIIFLSFLLGHEMSDYHLFSNDTLSVQPSVKQNIIQPKKDITVKDNNTLFTEENTIQSSSPEKTIITDNKPPKTSAKENIIIVDNKPIEREKELGFFESLRNIIIPNEKPLRLSDPLKYYNNLKQSQTLYNSRLIAEERTSNSDKIKIGGSYAPVYAYRTNGSNGLLNNSYQSSSSNNASSNNEKGISTYSFGVNAQYDYNKKWEFQSGIYYSRIGQTKNALAVKNNASGKPSEFQLTTSAGEIAPDKLPQGVVEIIVYNNAIGETSTDAITNNYIDANLLQQFDYLEIPFLAKYKLIDRRVDLKLIGGLSTGILIANETYFRMNGIKSSLGSTQNLKTMLYNSVVGIGIGYDITKKISLNIEPTFKYSLNSINTNSEYKFNPYSVGLFTGITIAF